MPRQIFLILPLVLLLSTKTLLAQFSGNKQTFTEQDTLRGSITKERAWWDVLRYDIAITPNYLSKSLQGEVKIIYKINSEKEKNTKMQIDLQEPMRIDKVISYNGQRVTLLKTPEGGGTTSHTIAQQLTFARKGNVYYINDAPSDNKIDSITIHFSGHPRIAENAPWDGGWIFTKDEKGRPWMTAACQGLGASSWYPCKDHQSDEPDNGASLSITIPDTLVAVGNGQLVEKKVNRNSTHTWTWEVKSPINNYNIIPYIGKYVNWNAAFTGEKGKLNCSYWVLDYNLEKSKKHFNKEVPRMLKCFEDWFGPYPFYKDSYKLIETPHLGMEHQSAIAYGNKYKNGYLGMDISGSGWGNKWDYIIIHETGHEWFANNITTADIADMWVHEGFTTYSEVLFVECEYGKKAANEYCQGLRASITNTEPIIGQYGVNKEGSGDMYFKGANLIHTLRQIINNDVKFKSILKGLNKDFYHSIVTTAMVEKYFSEKAGIDFSKLFDQYLRTTQIPLLEYKTNTNSSISFRWSNCIKGFTMPVKVNLGGRQQIISPTEEWKTVRLGDWYDGKTFSVDKNFYITSKRATN